MTPTPSDITPASGTGAAPQPGATYRFVVRSADEAVRTIREQLGPSAKVLSVRQVGATGIGGLFSRPKLEVIAQVGGGETESLPTAPEPLGVSSEPALPVGLSSRSGQTVAEPANPPSAALSTPASPAAARATPRDVLPRVADLLRRSGFSETMLSRLQTSAGFPADPGQPLHRQLVDIGQLLRQHASKRRVRLLPARAAFIGTPGVGRTTALCKWLAREVFAQARSGRVVKAEFDRPNPAEGLAVFCEALGLTLDYYSPEDGVGSVLEPDQGQFLYADLPGLSLRTPAENGQIAAFLDKEKFAGRVLVLNAAYDTTMIRRAYAVGADLGATHVVFTHLDEVEHWGKLWDFLLDGELSPLFFATGPSLTGDCEDSPLDALLRKTLPGS